MVSTTAKEASASDLELGPGALSPRECEVLRRQSSDGRLDAEAEHTSGGSGVHADVAHRSEMATDGAHPIAFPTRPHAPPHAWHRASWPRG